MREPNIETRKHDIISDPIEEAHFDVVHTRLVLVHIPERERAVQRMISALRPGGWALFEEFDSLSMVPDPKVKPSEYFLKTLGALWRVMTEDGVDLRFGRVLPALLEAQGLLDVAAEGRVFLFRGGSAGADMFRANFNQMHERLIASGYVTEAEFQADLARLNDPRVTWPSSIMWAVWGQRP